MTNPVSMRTENRLIVADYIYYRLHKKGLQWPNCPLQPSPGGTPPDPPSQSVERVLRSMGNEFEERYTQVFQNMCSQLDITPQNIRNTFLCTANELYTGQEVKWGRIVALFAFAGCLAADCVAKGMPDQVDQVLELTTDYINHNLMSWISQNGHWEGLIEFYRQNPEDQNDSTWPSFKTICGYAVGAIGVLTLGAIFSAKS